MVIRSSVCKVAAATVLAATSFAAGAATAPDNTKEICQSIYNMSSVIMSARQDGVSMPDAIKMMEGMPAQDVFEKIVAEAFDYPLVHDRKLSKQVETEFGSQQYKKCMEALAD